MAGLSDWQEECRELELRLSETRDKTERHNIIIEHLRNTDKKLKVPVPEFEPDLEWINTERRLSFASELKGGIVVLDFFTYCCINCMHILPDLEALEHEYPLEKGVTIVGVHSAKFDNEKLSTNIVSAVLRYGIRHAVVNDKYATLWKQLQIQCWPTLLLVGPQGNLLYSFVGEGHRDKLLEFVSIALDYYSEKREITLNSLPIRLALENFPPSPLLFPGKVCTNGKNVVVCDTGHNRIVVLGNDGIVQKCIGGPDKGLKDGPCDHARFNSPQGVCIHGNTIFVADTENHCIRKVDLDRGVVETVAGTGQMGQDDEGGKLGADQDISSPWDLALGSSLGSSDENLLFIAMAGSHQIWGLFLQDGKWFKERAYKAGTCIRLAGSGNEENRNNSYPEKAAFAQPSGLALSRHGDFPNLYVADAESSSIRLLSLKEGAVKALVGGERDPKDLFAYGDIDGKGYDAKLQHPLAVAVLSDSPHTLIVADSYNHKIKRIIVSTKQCNTVLGSGQAGNNLSDKLAEVELNEPGGICVDRQRHLVYIADTNNHSIKVFNIEEGKIREFPVIFPGFSSTDSGPAMETFKRLTPKSTITHDLPSVDVKLGGKLTFSIKVDWAQGLHLTEGAPSGWQVWTEDSAIQKNLRPQTGMKGTFTDETAEPSVTLCLPAGETTPRQVPFFVEAMLYFCDDAGICKMRGFMSKTSVTLTEESKDTETVNFNIHLS